jgi:uncharacterized protein (TIGR02996 family)
MQDTLAALYAAIIANPADRTVRLVYADALDESGNSANAARAEFIRAQVALEAMADDDPKRPALAARCTDLFMQHWIDWWKPVCAAVGLPEPYVPGKGIGSRVWRSVSGEKREPGHPYIAYPNAWSVRLDTRAFTAQFIAGFPELIAMFGTGIAATGRFGTWLSATPFCRIRFMRYVSEAEWTSLDGPHLAKLTELTFDWLPPDVAALIARSPLQGLTSLRVGPIHPAADVVRPLIHNPPWTGLRSLALLGTCAPAAIQTLATECTLTELEELSFAVGAVESRPPVTGFFGAIGAVAVELLTRFTTPHPTPPGPITGPDYWPALHALAHSPLFSRLRRFRISDADPSWLDRAAGTLLRAEVTEAIVEPFLSDDCVRTLANGLNPDKLERLELPRTRLSEAARAELTQRFGPRLVLT